MISFLSSYFIDVFYESTRLATSPYSFLSLFVGCHSVCLNIAGVYSILLATLFPALLLSYLLFRERVEQQHGPVFARRTDRFASVHKSLGLQSM